MALTDNQRFFARAAGVLTLVYIMKRCTEALTHSAINAPKEESAPPPSNGTQGLAGHASNAALKLLS